MKFLLTSAGLRNQTLRQALDRDLHASAASRVPPSAPFATWGQPDETVPATLSARLPRPTW